jgi:hypothetical protein
VTARDQVLEAYAESIRRRRAAGDVSRPILVGEDNPHGGRPENALFCHPPGSAGERLQRVVLGVSQVDYLADFDRVNLCRGEWNSKEAGDRAQMIVEQMWINCSLGRRSRVVLLGAKVRSAFQRDFDPFFYTSDVGVDEAYVTYVILPHPSGRCRAWNEPGAVERARVVLRAAGVLEGSRPANDR